MFEKFKISIIRIVRQLTLWYYERKRQKYNNSILEKEGLYMEHTITKASELLGKYKLNTASEIDLSVICQDEGIHVSAMDLSELEKKHKRTVAGVLFVKEQEKNIIVNKNDVPERQRFTIAHELGHYFLHFDRNSSEENVWISFRGERNKEEYEADMFAAELLMPEELVRAKYKDLPVPYVSALAKEFKVSGAAMRYRLDTLNMRYISL
ncbi:MAG: ImmA/IrrE family metallo-endopeptidase [Oscillospiraceae bacterium]|nr:ImmA/IrrE family metallo-endopeptidase [Oscillospiraceae bacterium]